MPKSATSRKTNPLIGDSRRSRLIITGELIHHRPVVHRPVQFPFVCFSVGRQILTKRVGADDDIADADVEDITSLYKNSEGISRHQKRGVGCFGSPFSNHLNFIHLYFVSLLTSSIGLIAALCNIITPDPHWLSFVSLIFILVSGTYGEPLTRDLSRDLTRDIMHFPGE